MNTVYLVTRGSYSDYRIVCAAATREAADEIVAFLNRAEGAYDSQVEEFEVVTSLAEARPRQAWTVYVDKDGNEVQVSVSTAVLDDELYEVEGGSVLDPDSLDREAMGESYRGHEVALKAARDALAQRKAEAEGIG